VKQLKIIEISARELAEKIKSKEISSEEVIKAYFEKIEEAEEKVDAFITLTEEDALKSAKKTDEKISRGEKLGAIEGVPVAIKDNIVTKGIKTTCASKILENFIPPYNATVVDKIKNEGGIIIGKTNMDEFAMGSSTENSRFKNTKNPYDLSRVPGGSSGGSAAAVASLEAPLALGSETGGSVRQPASFCGVVGIKPTYGLVSRYGLIAFASSLDQIGTLGRNVEDCAFMLNVISGYDDKDSTSVNMVKKDYMKYLSEDIKGMKIALPKEYFGEGVDKNISERIRESARAFEKLGATIEEVSLPYTQYALPCYYLIATSEASSNLARFDGIRYGYRAKDYFDINELYINTRSQGFGEEVKRRIMLGTYSLSSGYYDAYYKKAQKVRGLLKKDFDKIFEKYDLILSPTSPTLPFRIGERSDDPVSMYMADVLTVSVNLTGCCAISVPCGYIENLPVGLQLIGNRFNEEKILRAAYAFEKNSGTEKILPDLRGEENEI